jgi:hypothetical protein
MRHAALAGLLAFATLPALADDAADALALLSDADCATLACRPAGAFSLGTVDDQSFPVVRSPYVTKSGAVIVYPGESLVFEFPDAGATPGMPRYVPKPTGQEKNTLILTFKRQDAGGTPMMMLDSKSGLDTAIKFDATVTYLTAGGLVPKHSSTCAVLPHIFVNESWPQPLGPIVLTNFRFLSGGNMGCS